MLRKTRRKSPAHRDFIVCVCVCIQHVGQLSYLNFHLYLFNIKGPCAGGATIKHAFCQGGGGAQKNNYV